MVKATIASYNVTILRQTFYELESPPPYEQVEAADFYNGAHSMTPKEFVTLLRMADIAILNFGIHYDYGYPHEGDGRPPYMIKLHAYGVKAFHHRYLSVCAYVCASMCMCVCLNAYRSLI